ncbi:MAG: hypothetical protein K2L98_01065, partial [Bacilli bacterium]|nr:hypothetical protein [Bacilli bacterium]
PATQEKADLAVLNEMDAELDRLLEEEEKGSLIKTKANYVNEVIRLIILLDISGSMRGTEEDIYLGLSDLIKKHHGDNILVSLIAFNDDRYEIISDAHIDEAKVSKIDPVGGTDLNGTLYYALKEKCASGTNLLVAISDGSDTENKISTDRVRKELNKKKNDKNHYYFLGEPTLSQTPESVHANAKDLGFDDDHIAIFTREGNGNKLNFAVISQMLEDLIEYGRVSDLWSEPIKEHYLALTDKRNK